MLRTKSTTNLSNEKVVTNLRTSGQDLYTKIGGPKPLRGPSGPSVSQPKFGLQDPKLF